MNRLSEYIYDVSIAEYRKWQINKHGIWFVDIPKTSSTSIRKELGKKYGAVFDKKKNRFSYPPHRHASQLKTFLGEAKWNKLYRFSIVRNPWDKTLSYYLWAKSAGYLKRFDDFRSYILEIKKQQDTGDAKLRWYAYNSCADYLYSENGELLVDFIAKFENREADLEVIRKEINSRKKRSGEKLSKEEFGAIKVNVSDSSLFNQFYDEELIELIGIIYQRDIELFDYAIPSLQTER